MNEKIVYIIDDDPSVRKSISRLLSAAGYQSIAFASAKDFLDLDEYQSPGCIILDVQMPKMTGPELQAALGTLEYSLPIIFLTAHGDIPTAAKALKTGAMDFLTKPVDVDELLESIEAALSKDALSLQQYVERESLVAKIETLTSREYDTMTYVITGMLNKQIAAELGISEETVKIHRGRLMRKLRIVSVAELVRICEKANIHPALSRPPY